MSEMVIQATATAVSAPPPGPVDARGVQVAGATLLPAASTAFDVGDALTEIMKLSSALAEQQTEGSRNSVATASTARKEASERRMQAIHDAIEAARKADEEKSSGGFFDFVTDNLGPAALVGLVTGAAYIVAADFVAHSVGLSNDKLDLADAAGVGAMMAGPVGMALYGAQLSAKKFGPEELQKALDQGPAISDKDTRLANKLVLSITQAQLALAATVATGGTAAPAVVAMVGIAVSTTTQLLQESGALKEVFGDDARWVALGGTLAGAALSMGGGVGSVLTGGEKELVDVAVVVADKVKTGLEAAHDINQGVRNLRAAGYAHDSDNYSIAAQQQKQVLELVERMVETVIEDVKSIKESAQKTTEILQASLQTNTQTMLLAGTMKA